MSNPLGGFLRTTYTCPTCFLECQTSGGLTKHRNSAHRQFTPQLDDDAVPTYEYHPHLTGMSIPQVLYGVLMAWKQQSHVMREGNTSDHIPSLGLRPFLLRPQQIHGPLFNHALTSILLITISLRCRIQLR